MVVEADLTLRRAGTVIRCVTLLALACGVFNLAAQPYGLDQRPAVGAFLNGDLPPAEAIPSGWAAVVAFPNLTFDDAISMTPEPGTNRLYVCERQGKLYSFVNSPATATKTLFLDLTAQTQGYYDCGLMGFAFHPQYGVPGSTNRNYVYVYYSFSPAPIGPSPGATTPSYNRLSRFTVPDGSLVAEPASELVLINQFDESLWHNGSGMYFGSDGFLYLSNGDGGGVNDQYNHSQEINSGLFSGVLRLDVDQNPNRSHPIRRQPVSPITQPVGWPATYTTNYFVPNDNPWVNPDGSVLEEFWAIGLRSPHRMTYDSLSGRTWVGDVGQDLWEEVDIVEKGGNYQWAYLEGAHPNTNPTKAIKPNPLVGVDRPAVYEYPHANGDNCVIGGYVYRGTAHPSLYGKYIFGDYGSGRIMMMNYDGVNPTTVTQMCTLPVGGYSLTSFGLDQNQEIYMCVLGRPRQIYKLVATGGQGVSPPALLSQTGAFTNLATLSPSAALIPFDVNSPLWSDHAAKARWMAVPTNSTITFSSNGNWVFPIGTVMVKQFDLPVNDTNPAAFKRLETRFMVLSTNNSWFGFTYKWRADNTDADLLPGALNETNLITTATGTRTQVWSYPSRPDCRTCHNANAGGVLGPRTSQLNGDFFYPTTGRTDNQLRVLNHLGLLNPALNEANIPAYPKTVSLTNTAAAPEIRVRSYLEANCAHCHQPNGAQGLFDARFATPLENQGLVNGLVLDPLGITDAKIISPQSTAQSILYLRDNTVGGSIQMPPLAKNVVDTNYISVLAEWINSLPNPTLLVGMIATASTQVRVTYNKAVEPVSATNVSHYAITPGVTILGAAFSSDSKTIVLTTSPLATGVTYTGTVNGVNDLAVPPNTIAPNSQATFTLAPFVFWHAYDALLSAGSPQGRVFDEQGFVAANLEFYESTNNAGVGRGSLFSTFNPGLHPEGFNAVGTYWANVSGTAYPYAGKSLVARSAAEGNAPAPLGVMDLQLHPPNNDHLVVVAFVAPFDATYRISDLAARRVFTSGTTATYRLFGQNKVLIASLQAGNSTAWITDTNVYWLGQVAAGDRIYFTVDRDGNYGWDATETAWTVTATLANVAVHLQAQSVGGGQMQISWPVGTLLEATNMTGPWITNVATSPYTFTPTGSRKFFRVRVQ
ncbi:MAG: hypothetical protein HOP33_10025 [Verrucomicrobia bacterium]|nr:hypothetical protein [Verrucomicrobiota bacterium]